MIKDPATNNEVTDVEEIKRISLKYCVDLLTNREPKEGYEDIIDKKREVHKVRMNEIIQNDVEFSEDLYNDCITILKNRNNKK